MSSVVSCPSCDKKLAVKDELKGRALICPQCKARFTVPVDDAPAGDMDFLDSLSGAHRSGSSRPSAPLLPEAATARAAAPRAVGRGKKQALGMKAVYIGGGIAAAIALAIIVGAVAMNGSGGAATEPEDIRFGLNERTRIQLFQKLVSAVDDLGVTKSCKEEWFRLADEYKLDRANIKDLLDEGFSYKNKKWVLPEAKSTARNRETRIRWVADRHNGPDPVLAL